MFADVIRVSFFLHKSCEDVDYSEPSVETDYCSGEIRRGVVRAYSIIVGDADLECEESFETTIKTDKT